MRRLVFGISLVVLFLVGIAAGLIAMASGWIEWSTDNSGVWGKFPRPPVVALLENGRQLRLLADFSYIDARGTVWTAPKGSVVDGASIPQTFWTFTGGPLEGKFRNASIVHDVECNRRAVPSDKVHQMFYEACRCGGVPENEASLLYAAVYHFGPQWTTTETAAPAVVETAKEKDRPTKPRRSDSELVQRKKPTEADRKELEQFVHQKRRSMDELRHWRGRAR